MGRELFPSLRMGPDVLALDAHFLGGRPAACSCCAPCRRHAQRLHGDKTKEILRRSSSALQKSGFPGRCCAPRPRRAQQGGGMRGSSARLQRAGNPTGTQRVLLVRTERDRKGVGDRFHSISGIDRNLTPSRPAVEQRMLLPSLLCASAARREPLFLFLQPIDPANTPASRVRPPGLPSSILATNNSQLTTPPGTWEKII